MKKSRHIILITILIVTAILPPGKIPYEKFNSELCKTANLNLESNWSLRWDMMNDLRTKHKLVGMTKKEIIDLLGDPEVTASNEFSYYLGYTKTGINTGTLIIIFNENKIVTEIRVWQS